MHDLTFCREILEALDLKLKNSKKGTRFNGVKVSLSPLSHVTARTLEETFRTIAKATPFADIKLSVQSLSLGMKCEDCKEEFTVDKPTFTCPKCKSSSISVIYQKEFIIDSIETSCNNLSKKAQKL